MILAREDTEKLLAGSLVYGTGGGGDAEWGRAIMKNDFARGRAYHIIDPVEVPDGAHICSTGIMCSVKTEFSMTYEEMVAEWEKSFPCLGAVRLMERITGKKIDYLVPFEIGGLNTPVVLSAASRMGIPVVNADFVGRAAPETHMAAPIGLGVDLYPMPVVDMDGNEAVFMRGTPTFGDEIGRAIVVRGGGQAANAHYLMTGEQLKKTVVPHILTKAMKIGEILLSSNGAGKNPLDRVIGELGAVRMIQGRITEIADEDRGGFYLMNVLVKGEGPSEGHSARLVVKNETMALWIDGELRCMFPDYVFMLDTVTGRGIPSKDLAAGMDIMLAGAPCPGQVALSMQSEIAKKAFGASRYGYPELEYVPFATLNKLTGY